MHTISSRIASLLSGIALLLCAAMPAAAAVPPATHACALIVAPSERLDCYDRAFPPVHDEQTEASEQVRTFGLGPQHSVVRDKQALEAARTKNIASEVVLVGGNREGERVFTLNNGQVWRQTESRVLGLVRAGDAIHIRAGSFGTYLLITPGGVPLRVKRIW